LELSDFFNVLRRFWKSCALVVAAALGVAFVLTLVLPKQYTAKADVFVTVMLGNSGGDLASGANYAQNQVESFREVATEPFVLDRAIEKLGLTDTDAAALAADVSVSVPAGTSIMTVSAQRPDPESAAQVVDAVAESLVTAVGELAPTSSEGKELVRATILADAKAPSGHSFPSTTTFLSVGLLLGLLAGVGQALLRHLFDKRIRDESQLEELTPAPIMGRIGLDPQLIDSHQPATVSRITAEDYRRLRTNMQFVGTSDETRGKTLVITSSAPGEGKTAIAVNLATVLAEAGETVLLIDGDLRRPRIAQYLGLESSVGLTTVLIGWASPGEVLQNSRVANLTVMPSGVIPPNPSELLASRAMKQLLDSAGRHFDYTIVDCAPLLPVTDAAILARQTDGALLVADVQTATIPQVRFALDEIERANGSIIGLVLNKVRSGAKGTGSYYGYQEYGDGARLKPGAAHGAGSGSR
jgi:capsular exopolysaccharide synthesis family protein